MVRLAAGELHFDGSSREPRACFWECGGAQASLRPALANLASPALTGFGIVVPGASTPTPAGPEPGWRPMRLQLLPPQSFLR